jgi:leucine-zipper-like transcriptional regulator 1
VTLTSDTAVGLNDPIHLKITTSDKFGTIVKKELSIGGSPFFRTSQTDTIITSPPQPSDHFLCIYRVTDDDGNVASDSVTARVFSSPPSVHLAGDTMVGLFQPIRLEAKVQDNGTIVTYEWDIGGNGNFITTTRTDTILPNYNRPIQRLPCIFRATDEDGEIGLDTIFVNSSLFWHPVQPTSSLPERSGYGVVVHNEKMWIIGGDKPDVWNSSDGQNWELITDSAAFGPRYGHTTVSFRNRLWIIGGKVNTTTFAKGIWSSNDGRTWTLEADSSFMHRQYHTAKVFRDRLWIIGGINASDNEPCLHDIWSSPDGKQWELVSDSSGFPRRYGHGTVVFDNKFWVIGGLYDGMNSSAHLHDTWYSTDGKEWHKVSDSTCFAKNIIYSYIAFDNKLWAIGGYSDDGSRGFTDVWFSENGKRWMRATDSPSVTQRYATTAFIFLKRIWMSVGTDPSLWYCN